MKLIFLLLIALLFLLCSTRVKVNQNQLISSSTNIPTIHPEDNWMYGALASQLPERIYPTITTTYEEMLSNPKKKMISLGVNNSGIIDLNKTVVISGEPKYIYEEDGVQGTLAPVHKAIKKLPLTDQYEEMLKNTEKKLISLGVNSTAFYDPDNEIIIKGTEEANPINVLGKTLKEINEENKKTRNKVASFLENNLRFEEKI